MSFGIGFSHIDVHRKCNSALYGHRFKNSNFKKAGKSVLTKVKVSKRFRKEDLDIETLRRGKVHKNQ